MGFQSCGEEPVVDAEYSGRDLLLFGAGAADMLSSRAYTHDDDGGLVHSGIYYLFYQRATNSKFKLQEIDFGNAKYFSKFDKYYTTAFAPDGKSELRWSDIKDTQSMPLYLDNVNSSFGTTSADSVVTFKNTNPFVAGLMDDSNDLLWGSVPQKRTSRYIDFNLHHVMAGVRVKVIVDNSEKLADSYDLSKAEVYITNLIHTPNKYNRRSGTVSVAEKPEYKTLTLVNTLDGDAGQNWGSIDIPESDDDEYHIFTTSNFILPPQSITSPERPQVVVRFPNPTAEKQEDKPILEFFGYLPLSMETDYVGGKNYVMQLSFLREHILEIRTKITQNPPQLVFMPVKVYDWVKWGPYTLVGNQEGLYTDKDLYDIISYYSTDNEKMLARFGELITDGKTKEKYWSFDIFKRLTFNLDRIKGAMAKGNHKYGVKFNLHGHKVIVVGDDGSVYEIKDNNDFDNLIVNGVLPEPDEPGGDGN